MCLIKIMAVVISHGLARVTTLLSHNSVASDTVPLALLLENHLLKCFDPLLHKESHLFVLSFEPLHERRS